MSNQTDNSMKWYNKPILVNLLLILFFPVGLYALWKSETIAKWWKITASIIIGAIILIPSNQEEEFNNYSIIEEEHYETNGKAQLVEYLQYTDTIYSEEVFKKLLMTAYRKDKDKDYFENYDEATVFGLNVYTSKELYKSDKSEWIAMLIKSPNDSEPRLSFNTMKIQSLADLQDNILSKDEKELNRITTLLKNHDLELCELYKRLKRLNLESIQKADKKYPDYGNNHLEYSERLYELAKQDIATKHNVSDTIFDYMFLFGHCYCK